MDTGEASTSEGGSSEMEMTDEACEKAKLIPVEEDGKRINACEMGDEAAALEDAASSGDESGSNAPTLRLGGGLLRDAGGDEMSDEAESEPEADPADAKSQASDENEEVFQAPLP